MIVEIELAEEIRDQGVIWAGDRVEEDRVEEDRVEEDQVEVQLVVFQVGVAVQQVEVEESLEADDYMLGKT